MSRLVRIEPSCRRKTVVTDFVLTEIGNALTGNVVDRNKFVTLVDGSYANRNVTLVPASRNLMDLGLSRYRQRRDKTRSLTDCTSFVVMKQLGLAEALTANHPFVQAGFTTLMK